MQKEIKKLAPQKNSCGFVPVSKWNEFYSYPSVKSLRQIIFRKDKNGFTNVLRKINGRLYIAEEDFFKWINEKGKMAV